MKLTRLRSLAFVAALAAPLLAQAHPGHDGHEFGWDFTTGFAHPLLGWDHLAAMLAVGVWAAQLGGRARWLLPAAFVGTMVAAAALGRAGFAFTGLEQGIATTVVLLGLLIATAARLPLAAGTFLIGLFAAFHGLAHGAEMPATAGALGYGAGFVLTTALLLVLGVALGRAAIGESRRLDRAAGWLIAASGLVLLAA